MRAVGGAKAAPTGLAVVTMGDRHIGSPECGGVWHDLVCRQSNGTLPRTPGAKSSVRSANRGNGDRQVAA
jgi:hypothetical protein